MPTSRLSRLSFVALALAAGAAFASCDSSPLLADDIRRADVERIVIDDFPDRNPDGNDWDGGLEGGGDPDLYVVIETADGDLVFESGSVDNVELRDLPIVLDLSPGLLLDRLDEDLVVVLYDRDVTSQDDFIDETEVFRFEDFVPRSGEVRDFDIDLESPKGPAEITLRGRWLR